jgi:flagellar hook-length control protein FliK
LADGKVFAEIKTDNKASDLDTKVAELLKQLNLPVDEKNLEAARLLIKYKLPLDKEAITNIIGLKKSIENLSQSSEERVGLLLSGLNIKDTPVDVLNKIVLNWSDKLMNQEALKVISEANINNDVPEIIASEEDGQEAGKLPRAVTNKETVKSDNNGDNKANIKEIINANKPANAEVNKETVINKALVMEKRVQSAVKNNSAVLDRNNGVELTSVLERMGIKTGSEVRAFAGQVSDILASMKSTDMEAITYLVSKEMTITPRNISMLLKNIENSDGISRFLDKLRQRMDTEHNPELKAIKDSIKKLFLEPRQIEDGKEVASQLKDMARLGERLEKYLSGSKDYDPEIKDALSNLKDSIDFIRNINQHSNFLQLPILINGDTSTAKLYVFKEGKRNKAINPEDATIVVVLDLANLGHLESMIHVKGKTVNVTFRVENKRVGTILEKDVLLLKKSLAEKGYNLGPIRVISLEQPFSLLSLEEMTNERVAEKIHFDMRV